MSKKTFEKHDLGGVVFQYSKGPNLTVTIGKEKRTIKKTDLWMLVFMNAKGKTQDDLIPVWEKEMVQFIRQYEIVCKKDMKAGEKMTFHAKIDVLKIVVESIIKKEGIDPATIFPKKELSTPPEIAKEKAGV